VRGEWLHVPRHVVYVAHELAENTSGPNIRNQFPSWYVFLEEFRNNLYWRKIRIVQDH
jgi:hypothetical protein